MQELLLKNWGGRISDAGLISVEHTSEKNWAMVTAVNKKLLIVVRHQNDCVLILANLQLTLN